MPGRAVLPSAAEALPGRGEPQRVAATHAVSGNPTLPPFPDGMQVAIFGMGCFWGAERLFWKLPGVFSTQVGFAGGFTPNPTYEEVRSGLTGHAEVVRVVFDPQRLRYEELLRVFWENHDPTQGMRQQEDVGTQYRSVIFTLGPEQHEAALRSRAAYQEPSITPMREPGVWVLLCPARSQELTKRSLGTITTGVEPASNFFYAEDWHQQYLHKIPSGTCELRGTGVACPVVP